MFIHASHEPMTLSHMFGALLRMDTIPVQFTLQLREEQLHTLALQHFGCDIILGRVPFWLTFLLGRSDYVTAGGSRPRPFVFVPIADFAEGK